MSFSSIAIEQREKEIKALKTFLVYSTVGSLVLHIAVLASGIGNLLARAPELENEPIEMTFVEPEVEEAPIKEEKKPSPEDNKLGAGKILTSSGGSSGGSAGSGSSTQSSPQIQAPTPVIVQALPQAPVPVPKPIEKPIVPQPFTPVQKQVETKQPQSVTPPQPLKEDPVVSKEPPKPVNNIPKETTSVQKPLKEDPVVSKEPPKPVNNIPKETTSVQKPVEKIQPQESQISPKVATNTAPVQSSTSTQESSENLTNTLGNIRDLRATQPAFGNGSSNSTSSTANSTIASGFGTGNGTGSGTGTGTGNGYGTGTGSGTGTGTGNGYGSGTGNGNGTGSGTGKIAAAPTKPKIPQGNGGSGDGRDACISCENLKYPESARRRKVEGVVEVAIDADKDGNVTNVRLTRSSGDRELDEETQRKAREWKLKPSEAGRQGVKISTNFSMKGSRRNREVEQRQQQRAERERQQQRAERERQQQRAERERQRQLAGSSDNNNSGDETPGRRRRNLEPSGESASSNEELRSPRLNQGLPQSTEVSPPKNETETPTPVRNPEESSINNPLGRPGENNSGSAAPTPDRPREVNGDVRTSGEQQPPTKRKKRELNQSNQSSDSTSQLRGVLRRSGESAPAAPSSDAEGE
ncbi:MAG: TonB family protein [Hassallia sp. WJT32-NPBG1]|jgi:TonB family protein|nr:TonB family protein [Hassallia sp. WJT32-NPBG1]